MRIFVRCAPFEKTTSPAEPARINFVALIRELAARFDAPAFEPHVTIFVTDAESAAAAIKNVDKVDRKKCREYFEKRFTSTRMAEDYVAIYERLIKGQAAPIPHSEGALSWTKSA